MDTSTPKTVALDQPGLMVAADIYNHVVGIAASGFLHVVRMRLSLRAAATIIAAMHMPEVDSIAELWGIPVVIDEALPEGWRLEVEGAAPNVG